MHTGSSEEQLAEETVRGKMKDCCYGSHEKKGELKREVVNFSKACKFTEDSNGH